MTDIRPFIIIENLSVDTSNVDAVYERLLRSGVIKKVENTLNHLYIEDGLFLCAHDLEKKISRLDLDLTPLLEKLQRRGVIVDELHPFIDEIFEIRRYIDSEKSWKILSPGSRVIIDRQVRLMDTSNVSDLGNMKVSNVFHGYGGYALVCGTEIIKCEREYKLLDVSNEDVYDYIHPYLDDKWFRDLVYDGLFLGHADGFPSVKFF
jgi:hypothetical protein